MNRVAIVMFLLAGFLAAYYVWDAREKDRVADERQCEIDRMMVATALAEVEGENPNMVKTMKMLRRMVDNGACGLPDTVITVNRDGVYLIAVVGADSGWVRYMPEMPVALARYFVRTHLPTRRLGDTNP